MKRKDLVAIADAIAVVRPDWQQPGIIAALQTCAHTWQGSDAALVAHAVAIAARPDANTPAAINVLHSVQVRLANTSDSKEPTCYVCALTRSQCRALHDFELAHGMPDPHIFETLEEADGNSVRFDPRQLALAATPRVNDHEDSPERTAAKTRAREAVDQARQKSKWRPKPEPDTRRVQEPWPEETPA